MRVVLFFFFALLFFHITPTSKDKHRLFSNPVRLRQRQLRPHRHPAPRLQANVAHRSVLRLRPKNRRSSLNTKFAPEDARCDTRQPPA